MESEYLVTLNSSSCPSLHWNEIYDPVSSRQICLLKQVKFWNKHGKYLIMECIRYSDTHNFHAVANVPRATKFNKNISAS